MAVINQKSLLGGIEAIHFYPRERESHPCLITVRCFLLLLILLKISLVVGAHMQILAIRKWSLDQNHFIS
jgi:hypothetical protein